MFFDDFQIQQVHSKVVQSDDYYPFGLTFNSYKRENSVRNRYLYNQGTGEKKFSTERIFDLELNIDLTKYRVYDPAIGRFCQVDPLSNKEELPFWSRYHYSYDNPLLYNDPEGDKPPRGRRPKNHYRSKGMSDYNNLVARQKVKTTYSGNAQRGRKTGPPKPKAGIRVGDQDSPGTLAGNLVRVTLEIADRYNDIRQTREMNLEISKVEVVNENSYGGRKVESMTFNIGGPDGAAFASMEAAYQGKAQESIDQRFSAYAERSLGIDVAGLNQEELSNLKAENAGMINLISSVVYSEMGPSPKEQVIQAANGAEAAVVVEELPILTPR